MTLRDALLFVRQQYLDEQKNPITAEQTAKYKKACEQYPVTMKTAHLLWAQEISKTMP